MRGRHWAVWLLVTVAVGVTATPILADTVYLKNGRILRSTSVRVEGDRVFVRMYGGEVAFPLSMVERIVEDEYVDPEPTAQPPEADPEADPDDPANQGAGAALPGAVGDPDDPTNPAGDPPPPDPEQTRAYWQTRVGPLREQIERMERELRGMRSRNMADVQNDIDRLEARQRTVERQLSAIVTEARRKGVPVGWLR